MEIIPVLQWALIVGIILTVFIVGIIMYLTVQRFKQKKREDYITAYNATYLDAWNRYLVDGDESVTLTPSHRKGDHTFYAVDRIFSNYVTIVQNDEVKKRISRYAEVHFQRDYRAILRSHNWGIRMNALYRIFHYDLTFLIEDVRSLLQKGRFKNFEDYSLMLKILAPYNETIVIAHLLKPRLPFKEYEYKHIVFYLPEHYFIKLTDHFDNMPKALQISLLEYFTYRPGMDRKLLHLYEKHIQSDDPEIRIRALKAIYKFGLVTNISMYERFIDSPLWEERMMFARIVTNGDLQYATDKLRLLICDSSWWVRKRAAYSLFHLKNGTNVLKQIIDEAKDPYAVEAAKEILKVE